MRDAGPRILNLGDMTIQGPKGAFLERGRALFVITAQPWARAPNAPPPVPTSLIVGVSLMGGLKLQVTDKYRYKRPHTS